MLKGFLPIVVLVILPPIGQVLMKYGMGQVGQVDLSFSSLHQNLLKMLTTPAVVLGLSLYGISSYLMLVMLSKHELNFINLVLCSSYVFILLASVFIFKEHISMLRWAGAGMIIAGVYLVVQN
ncbi:MAG: hypothetical protein O2954_04075 [bacterium]|nr:hypothetical protein [bacterium]